MTGCAVAIVRPSDTCSASELQRESDSPSFAGVFVELSRVGQRYVLRETAAGSGNRLLKIDLGSEGLARALFEGELRRG